MTYIWTRPTIIRTVSELGLNSNLPPDQELIFAWDVQVHQWVHCDTEQHYGVVLDAPAPGPRVCNLTPHTINVFWADKFTELTGEPVLVLSVPPFNRQAPARCSMKTEHLQPLGGVLPVLRMSTGEISDLPEPEPDTIFIVSRAVAAAAPERTDIFCPGKMCIVNGVRGCEGLVSHCPEYV